MKISAHPPDDALTDEPDQVRPRKNRRRLTALLLVSVAVVVTIVALALVGFGVRADAESGRVAVAQGRRALLAGDLERAQERFEAAEPTSPTGGTGLRTAWEEPEHPPVLGRTFDVASGVADAGATLAAAAADLTEAIASLPDGLGSLAPSDGSLPIETVSQMGDEVALAADAARAALAEVRATPSSLLPAVVADARFEAEEQMAFASRSLDAASLLVEGLPHSPGPTVPDGTS